MEISKKKIAAALFNSLIAKLIIKAIAVTISGAVVLSPFCVTEVQEHELVMVSRFGKLNETLIKPGLHWFWPFIDKVHRYDTRPRDYDINGLEKTERELEEVQGIGTLSKDGWHMGVITHILYSLDKSKAANIIRSFGKDDSESSRRAIEKRIEVEVRHSVQNLAPQFEVGWLLSHRDMLGINVMAVLGLVTDADAQKLDNKEGVNIYLPSPLHPSTRLIDLGIEIHYISFELDLPKEYSMERLNAATNKEQIKTLSERLTLLDTQEKVKEKEIKISTMESIKKAETEAYMIKTVNQEKSKIPPYIIFSEKWDGKLPQIIASDKLFDGIMDDKVSNALH